MAKLTPLENRMLDFAESSRSLELVRTEFGWRPATYVMKLRELVAKPEAEQERPFTVRLIQGRLAAATSARASRSFLAAG